MRPLVQRSDIVLRPDPRRVITKLFLPGQELLIKGDSRAEAVLRRLEGLTEEEVAQELAATQELFAGRHGDLDAILTRRFDEVAPRLEAPERLSHERRLLIGATFTMEFAVEAAALFNPSMVEHPDQSDLPPGWVRFVMSVRALGEGHVSSIEFRTGTVDPEGRVAFEPPPDILVLPEVLPTVYSKQVFITHYGRRRPDGESAAFVFDRLPDFFDIRELAAALNALRRQTRTRGPVANTIERFEWMAASTYSIAFRPESEIAARVIYPVGPAESHGMEDLRLVRYSNGSGQPEYRGTYTAFTGNRVAPQLMRTTDFTTFHVSQLAGGAAQNKGMALFPRPVEGRELALSRWDRETISLASSEDFYTWEALESIEAPGRAWDLIQLGNCGSPIETEHGWLVLTHGVGPMRRYVIGAALLDLADPSRLIASLPNPLIAADEEERVGYVPNVVYSCGAMRHGDRLVVPYGCSDSHIRVAVVDIPRLLDELEAA